MNGILICAVLQPFSFKIKLQQKATESDWIAGRMCMWEEKYLNILIFVC